jgi:hypothetical protein
LQPFFDDVPRAIWSHICKGSGVKNRVASAAKLHEVCMYERYFVFHH